MGRPRKYHENIDELIAKSNKQWCQRKTSYEPRHRYAGSPSMIRWEEINRQRIPKEQSFNEYISYG